MKVFFNKAPKGMIGVNGPYYMARAVDQTGKWEFVQMVQSHQNLPKFISQAEHALKEQCSEVLFHNSWTKKREEIIAAAPEASYGFPHGAVSASKVGGNDLTAGETAPIDPNKWAFDHGLEST
jgi:hypothetical protein